MSEKKDVLFLCQYFYPEYVSSATLPFDTAKALVKAGYSVSTLCGYPNEYNNKNKVPTEEIYEGIKIKRLKYLQLKRSNFLGRIINYFSFTFAVFLRFFTFKNYRIIIVYSNPPVLPLIIAWASKVFKIKMVFVSYDVYPEMAHITNSISENGFISKLMQFINKRIYGNATKVVALSNEMKEYLLNNREYIQEQQIEVIPNWYEAKVISDTSESYLNSKLQVLNPNKKLIVSYFGNMGICQDLGTILGAIKKLKDDDEIQFFFAGHGNKMAQLQKSVEENQLTNVTIYEFLHGKDFEDALNISDVFLVSLTEGLTGLAVPSKTYSYMMAGKPVIAIMGVHSDISQDLLNNNAGFAIEVGEIDQLIESILVLKRNPTLRSDMGLNIRRVFEEKYTTTKATLKYIDMISELLEEN